VGIRAKQARDRSQLVCHRLLQRLPAARCVARHGVRSHAVPVALVGDTPASRLGQLQVLRYREERPLTWHTSERVDAPALEANTGARDKVLNGIRH
jgi:hypothetical protein